MNWELARLWKSSMTSPLPMWEYKYPLIGVFALVCVLIYYLFALESISFFFSASEQPFLGIFALSFLSRLGKREALGYWRVWGGRKTRLFSLFSLLPLASLTMADSPAWLRSLSTIPALVLFLGTTVLTQLLGSVDNSYSLSPLHGEAWLSVVSTPWVVSPFSVWFLSVSVF